MLDILLIALMAMWLLDGLALLANPQGVVCAIRELLDRHGEAPRWWALSSVLGIPLFLLPSSVPYRALWLLVGSAIVIKGLFLGLAPARWRNSFLVWCLSRDDVDYRFWGLGLCALAIVLWHSLGVVSASSVPE
ncbi:hypothetical protein YTPLAS18_03370 [Nitrospira sp.]|nr:hypothetical protein YTPLAS18_03370 [Nitrospira sp.]